MIIPKVHIYIFIHLLVSAREKQKYYDGDLSDPDISSFSNYESLTGADLSSALDMNNKLNEFEISSIDSISIKSDKNDLNAIPSTSGHIKRYKMERKNSQQSQHGKQESFLSSIPGGESGSKQNYQLECDPSLLELIGDKEIRVKIADLGNACFFVRGM